MSRWPSGRRTPPTTLAAARSCSCRSRPCSSRHGTGVSLTDPYNWWRPVQGADWRHPVGPGSSIRSIPDHPVVHVAWADVLAYASGRANSCRPSPPPPPPPPPPPAGYQRTSPVGAFPANGYGVYDMIGNVWEWTSDWYAAGHDIDVPARCGGGRAVDTRERSIDPHDQARIPRKVMKGGSHLCAPNYCRRYRPAARMAQPVDTSTSHLGFRCVVRAQPPAQDDGPA